MGKLLQFVDHMIYGNSVSESALFLDQHFRVMGLDSDLYVGRVHENEHLNMEYFTQLDADLPEADALFFHLVFCSDAALKIAKFKGLKCMIYHNVTPASLSRSWDTFNSNMLVTGRLQLKAYSRYVDCAVGVSEYNCAELRKFGFRDVQYCPLTISPRKWQGGPDQETLNLLSDGRTNIVFVGSLSPNKRQDQALKWFKEYLKTDHSARLILVGSAKVVPSYAKFIQELIKELRLADNVIFMGHVDDSQFLAVMQAASLYLSFSDHEGFGIPLIEAMWFDVPVLAYATSAVPETLGDAGVLFYDNENFSDITLKVKAMLENTAFRDGVLQKQRERRQFFLPENVIPYIDNILKHLSLR